MASKLLIVESPAKCKTIAHYLGAGYIIKASMGHVSDLPEKGFGVDVESDFTPKYVVSADKKKFISEIKKDAKNSDEIYLASDPDREGEAIAWHIANALGESEKNKIKRIQFNEITKSAITAAIANPRNIDMDRVNAQQARRILDRIVGYKISPVLWKTLYRGLSAGRVQSVALRIICEREAEIRKFNPQEYWMLTAYFDEQNVDFSARLVEVDSKKINNPDSKSEETGKNKWFVSDEKTAQEIYTRVKNKPMKVIDVVKQEKTRRPYAPFITSSLQQDAARAFGFSSAKTMQIAQQLYEGVSLGKGGNVGLITYMRTDSTRISNEALFAVKKLISQLFDKKYHLEKSRFYGKSESAQDAHEAIRPAHIEIAYAPNRIQDCLSKDQLKLYELIWKRFIASQMPDAILDATRIDFEVENCIFRANGSVVKFDGFLAIYEETNENFDNESGENEKLPNLNKNQSLIPVNLDKKQRFTKPAARYSEASLVRELEKQGIGRPSTYASIIEVLRKRKYVEMEKKRFVPTEIGIKVNDILISRFSEFFAVGFTASMETKLDEVEEGKVEWIQLLKEFYTPFEKNLTAVSSNLDELKKQHQKVSEKQCPKCGAQLIVKNSRNGEFLACPNFPDCKYIEPLGGEVRKETDKICEKCGSKMMLITRDKNKFLRCSKYPECDYTESVLASIGIKCPKCGGDIVKRNGRRGSFYGCSKYPKCDFVIWNKPVEDKCPKCGCIVVNEKENKTNGVFRQCPLCGEAWDLSGNKVEPIKRIVAKKAAKKETTNKKS
ncbi:MAG: type I DNA topoisomerase [Chitinispirillales bacterium]|jgi:DNA topoisomerase-1|nr:type I DNA topoisomerase [Chitinispirillales bacterium]